MRCNVTDDNTDAAGYPVRATVLSSDDGGPKARTRGNYAGFLPPTLSAELRASVDSGAGLALIDAPASGGPSCSPVLKFAAVALILIALR